MKTGNTAKLPDLDRVPRALVAHAADYPAAHTIDWHTHARAQLLYASAGVMRAETAAGTWVVPPQRAVWLPAGVRHRVDSGGRLSMRTLYIDPQAAPGLPQQCCVVAVSPLLRELILSVMRLPRLYPEQGPAARLVQVLLDQIRDLPVAPLHLPVLHHPRLRALAAALHGDPGDRRPLESWAKTFGMSSRNLSRLFRREAGMSFREWRQQLCLHEALQRLARREPVTIVATDLGYESTSAFIAMFRRALGTTPGRYFAES